MMATTCLAEDGLKKLLTLSLYHSQFLAHFRKCSGRSLQLFLRLEEELAAQPGVVSVSASIVPLLAGSNSGNSPRVQGFPTGPDVDNNSRYNEIGAGYFRTIGVTMLAHFGCRPMSAQRSSLLQVGWPPRWTT